jgi:hypothetical protein
MPSYGTVSVVRVFELRMSKVALRIVRYLALATIVLASPAPAQEYIIAHDNALACQNWDTYTSILQYIADKDTAALEQAYTLAIMTGDCVVLKRGENVFIVQSGFLSTKVRRRGETVGYWTAIENVRQLGR